MKHIKKNLSTEVCSNALFDFYFKGMKTGILDIETTGLNPAVNKFVLGGLYNCHDMTIHQFFAERKSEEADTICAFMEEISKVDIVITYNGRHFDMPFIEKRMKAHFGSCPPLSYNLDLYLVLNGHSPIKRLVPNLKQKTVENYMGLWQSRSDEISGAESVELYNRYEKTGDPALEEKILLHNSDDVIQLTRLTSVIMKSDFHKAMFHLGFPAGGLLIDKITIRNDGLIIKGHQSSSPFDYMGFTFNDVPVESRFTSRTGDFHFKLPLIWDSGYVIVDIMALGMSKEEFAVYPGCSSGFLVLESTADDPHKNYMEINHFVKSFITLFMNSI